MQNLETDKPLLLAVIPAMVLPCLGSIFYFVIFSHHPLGRIIYGAVKLFTLVWPLVCVWWILKEPFPRFSLREKKHLASIPLGLGAGAAIVVLMLLLLQTPLGDIVQASSGAIREKALQLGFLKHYLLFSLFLALFHSLLEEYYWRWFVYGSLSRLMPRIPASILAAAAFSAHHIVIATQFFPSPWSILLGTSVGIGGLIWNELYRRQDTLVGAWLSHIVVDLGILSIGYQFLFR